MRRPLVLLVVILALTTLGSTIIKRGPGGTSGGTGLTTDSVSTDELDDGANDPSAGECVIIDAGCVAPPCEFDYQVCAGAGDITAVGPGCPTGACWTDGVTTTGSTLLVWEGDEGVPDTNEFRLFVPTQPAADINITFPGGNGPYTGTLVGTDDTGTVSDAMLATDFIAESELTNEAELETQVGGINIIVSTEIGSSAQLAGLLSDETGTGRVVYESNATIGTPQLTLELTPASTDEGRMHWASATDRIVVGDGVGGTVTFYSGDHSSELSGEPFVTVSSSANLTSERVLTGGAGVDVTDDGADTTVTLTTDSQEPGFVFDADGTPISCGGVGDAGKVQVNNNGTIQWCDSNGNAQSVTGFGTTITAPELFGSFVEFSCDGFGTCTISSSVVDSDNIVNNSITTDDVFDDTLTRADIDETQLSAATHATDCTTITCNAAADGQMCLELDDDVWYVCDGPASTWTLVAMFGLAIEDPEMGTDDFGDWSCGALAEDCILDPDVVLTGNIDDGTILAADIANNQINYAKLDNNDAGPGTPNQCVTVAAGGTDFLMQDCDANDSDDLARDGSENMEGSLMLNDSVGDSPQLLFMPATSSNWTMQGIDSTGNLRVSIDLVGEEDFEINNVNAGGSINLTLDGNLTIGDGTGNDYLEAVEEATNPACGAGDYFIWANSVDAKWKKCENGTPSDLDTTGAANSFETHQTPAGTNPTATSSTDTLIWAAGSGNITITGDSGTKTITLDVPDNWVDVVGDTMTGNLVMDDNVDPSPTLSFVNLANETWTLSEDAAGDLLIVTDEAASGTVNIQNSSTGTANLNITDALTVGSTSNFGDNATFDPNPSDSAQAIFDTAANTDWYIYAEDTDGDLQLESDNINAVQNLDIVNPNATQGTGTVELIVDGGLTTKMGNCTTFPIGGQVNAPCEEGSGAIRMGFGPVYTEGWTLGAEDFSSFIVEPDLVFRVPDNNITAARILYVDTADGVGGEAGTAGILTLTVQRAASGTPPAVTKGPGWLHQSSGPGGTPRDMGWSSTDEIFFEADNDIYFLTGTGVGDEIIMGSGANGGVLVLDENNASTGDARMEFRPTTGTVWALDVDDTDDDFAIITNVNASTERMEIRNDGTGSSYTDLAVDGIITVLADAAPTLDEDGDFAIDETEDQWVYEANAAEHVLDPLHFSVVTLDYFTLGQHDDAAIFLAAQDVTVQKIGCHCGGGCATGPTLIYEDKDGNQIGGSPTCSTTTGLTSFLDVSGDAGGDNVLPEGDRVRIGVSSPGTGNEPVTFTVAYTIDRQ